MRGRVYLKAGERDIELRFTTNALCRLEEASGRSVSAVVQGMSSDMRIADLRLLVWAAANLETVDEAGDIIDEAGFTATVEAIGRTVEAAFPDAAPGGKKVRPAA